MTSDQLKRNGKEKPGLLHAYAEIEKQVEKGESVLNVNMYVVNCKDLYLVFSQYNCIN